MILHPSIRSRTRLGACLLLAAGLFAAPEVRAQTAVVQTEENFRVEPNGAILGQLSPGTRLAIEGEQGGWLQVTLEGFVWTRSMHIRSEGGFDLVITEADGENVRDEPQGRLAGRLVSGTRLVELERVPGWVRVRRTGWIWRASVAVEEAVAPQADDPQPADDAAPAGAPAAADEWLVARQGGLPLLTSPDGDTVGRAAGGADLQVLSREGGWARVRLDGWVWVPGDEEPDAAEAEGEILSGLSPAEIASEPERYRGRRVELELQFLSLERAEAIRRDFYEGEPFLLTRSAEGERRFVYVAVAPERLPEVEGLAALDRIRVVGRVRVGAAAFTENPVLELIRLERLR
jgi:hypothetical protein